MDKTQELANRLNEVLLSGHWIAHTNFKAQIENLSWEQATEKIGNLNTIASLTFHINYYLAGLINVFQGGELEIRDQYSFDLPPIKTQNDWQKLVNEFIFNSETFIREIQKLKDSQLDKQFVKPEYGTYLRNIEGVIEHSYYHLGQISLLNKIRSENSNQPI